MADPAPSNIKAAQLGVLLSSMSPATAALVLGRSAAWVAARRLELLQAPADPAPPADPEPVQPEPAPFLADFGCGPGVDPEEAMNRPVQGSIPVARPRQAPPVSDPISTRPRAVEILRPLTPRRLRYATWFRQAGWRLPEIAELFDLDLGALAEVLT